ncbi:hypothetical protein J2X65_001672 [Ancylobacter sp. 3268]|uniref:hypothetical protein n=1 Tax=Ancylobacter sp. 3268 TaxID=2817752 RepID=UPI00286711D7|nr:hypothetical protein [Ancylobacter sp. 3268]MDR6952317.1 hypothetical protein [Ancylobacter sp. 3268]
MAERAISDSTIFRLRAAQRDLIDACGGIARAAKICNYSAGHVGRWNNPNDNDLMPITAVVALEGDCGRALVTSIMADLNGRDLTDGAPAEATGNVDAAYADVLGALAAATSEYAIAKEDGRISPSEAERIDRAVAHFIREAEELRAGLASIKAPTPRLVREA